MESRLILYCIAAIILGAAAITLPLAALGYPIRITSESFSTSIPSYQDTVINEKTNGATAGTGNPPLNAATNAGLLITLSLILASSSFILLKRYLTGQG